jgi:AmiR/NasT family two-component response regulator
MKTIKISDEAYEVVRKTAFEQRKKMHEVISSAILNNVEKVD